MCSHQQEQEDYFPRTNLCGLESQKVSIRIAGREVWIWLGVDRKLKCTSAA